MTDRQISEVSEYEVVRPRGLMYLLLHIKALDLPGIKSHQWRIQPCSAVTGDNLFKGLDWVVDDVGTRLYYSSADSSAL